MTIPSEKNTINNIKTWLFPSIVAILGWMIKSDISEMKSDVKSLLAQSNIDKTKIEHLESDVQALNKAVFKISHSTPHSSKEKDSSVVFAQMIYGKPEEMYDIKKQLNIIED
jgi:hypothetical protein